MVRKTMKIKKRCIIVKTVKGNTITFKCRGLKNKLPSAQQVIDSLKK